MVEHLAVAEAVAAARLGQQVGRVGHRFHAAGDDDAVGAGEQAVMAEHGRLHRRAAHLVDGRAAGRQRQSGLQRGLPGGRLALAGLQHAAHQHLLDQLGGHAGTLDGGPDGDGAQVGGGQAGEAALEATHRRAGSGDDDYGIGHLRFLEWFRGRVVAAPADGQASSALSAAS